MLREIFKKTVHFTSISFIYISDSKLKKWQANGDSIAKVSIEGW